MVQINRLGENILLNYYQIVVFILICSFSILSCNKTDIEPNSQFMDQVVFEDYACLNPEIDWNSMDYFSNLKVVVSSESAYTNLINTFISESNCGCPNFCKQEVNFAQYSLLACATYGFSSNAEYTREVIKDSQNKQITYRITVNYINNESEARNQFNLNWAKIPSIEFGYTVKFEVIE